MTTLRKTLREKIRAIYFKEIISLFENDEEVLRIGSKEVAFPTTDSEGNFLWTQEIIIFIMAFQQAKIMRLVSSKF